MTLVEMVKQSGVSARRIAIKAGVEPGLLSAYMAGKRPNRRNAERVAAALGQSARDVWGQALDSFRTW